MTTTKKATKKITAIAEVPSEAAAMQAQKSSYSAKRKVLVDFIRTELVKGTDYDEISLETKSGKKFKSKPTLLKPGAEKVTSLLQLTATFAKDTDTWEMSGNVPRLYCYVCRLSTPDGVIVSEGRGVCSAQEKSGSDNTAVKIAEKRAHLDAVLRLGLSDSFTQDLDDMTAPQAYTAPSTTSATKTPYSAQRATAQATGKRKLYIYEWDAAANKPSSTLTQTGQLIKGQLDGGADLKSILALAHAKYDVSSYAERDIMELAERAADKQPTESEHAQQVLGGEVVPLADTEAEMRDEVVPTPDAPADDDHISIDDLPF